MKKFRLPRKTKRKLQGIFWLYPSDEKGGRLMAFPHRSQEDYIAFKEGIIKNVLYNENPKSDRKAYREKMNKEISVPDEILKVMIDNIFAERFRISSYTTLINAKKHPKAVVAYYNFINAYNLSKDENGSGNVCCLAVDYAKDLLKKK